MKVHVVCGRTVWYKVMKFAALFVHSANSHFTNFSLHLSMPLAPPTGQISANQVMINDEQFGIS